MAPPLHRADLIAALTGLVEGDVRVRAAWLGGSDASGRTDEHSDVDLVLVATDGDEDAVIETLEAGLAAHAPVADRYRLPAPTWHGHEQAFYRFVDGGPDLLLDLVVQRVSATDRLLERERHGEAVVVLDRDGIVVAPPFDRAAHEERLGRRRADLVARFPIFQSLVTRAIARGHASEAMHFYRAMTLVPLVELLRMHHDPDRFDFGVRYLDRDLPPELAATVDRLSFPADLEALRACRAEAEALFARYATG